MKTIIKRVYDFNGDNNSIKVLVDRLWPRGIKKEKLNVDIWAKELAPSNELRKWFNHDDNKFNEFQEQYIKELNNNSYALDFKNKYKDDNVILLYSASNTKCNNAVVLKYWLDN
jgi:uncharacterized protein YeaO (DUF488 family)